MSKSMMKVLQLSGKSQTRVLIVLIASVVFACYMPTLNNGFVWDDDVNFTENFNYRGLSTSHLNWMFTTFHDANFHPLAWLTLGFDFVLWGMNPAGYHLTNLVLHVLNAVLFFFLIIEFLRLTSVVTTDMDMLGIKVSAIVGALFFAIHPLRVETVSWISTRGDLLCGIFYLLTIIAYVRMNDKKSTINRRKWFLLSILFFVFSLLSRAWGITLPLVLLILDFYPLRRLVPGCRPGSSFKKLLIEKIPFALLALGGGVVAFLAKKGSMLNAPEHGVIDRFMQAAYGLCFYLYKTIVPVRLSPFYLLDKSFNPIEAKYITCALLVLCITLVLIIMRRRWPWTLTAWVCYAVIVSPLLGFVQSGPQIAADRYTYISCMPFGILVGAGILRMLISWRKESYLLFVWLSVVTAILTGLLFLTVNSSRHVKFWHDSRSLWNHVLQLNPDNYLAYYNRGVLNQDQGRLAEAIADYSSAVKLDPEYSEAYYNRGISRESQGDITGAIVDYSEAIQLNPKYVEAYNNRGVLRKAKGDLAGAVTDFNTAIRLNPLSPEAYANRGVFRLSQNDLKRAVQDFTKALEVAPGNWSHRVQIEQILNDVRARLDS
jgi:Tfp pilus assembly protein PilF